jgi:hypothetical protein
MDYGGATKKRTKGGVATPPNETLGPLDRGVLYGRMSMLCGPTVTFN